MGTETMAAVTQQGPERARRPSRLERTAYHEAGHAVAAYVLHRPLQEVTIIPSDDALGHVRYGPCPPNFDPELATIDDLRTRARIETYIMTAMAGVAAEARLTGRHNWVGGSRDMYRAVDLALYMTGNSEEHQAYVQWLFARTKGLWRHPVYWNMVEALAAALRVRRRLGRRQTRAIIAEAIQASLRETQAALASGALKIIRTVDGPAPDQPRQEDCGDE